MKDMIKLQMLSCERSSQDKERPKEQGKETEAINGTEARANQRGSWFSFLSAVARRFSLLTKTNNPKPEAGHQLILTGLSEHIINTGE